MALLLPCALGGAVAAPWEVRAQGGPVLVENLLSVITPVHRGTVGAHPWVNVRVQLGTTSDGTPADPATFRARLGRCDLSALFEEVSENGIIGKQVRLEPNPSDRKCRFRVGRKGKNRLKFRIRATGGARAAVDVDRVRFAVETAANQPPTADFTADPSVLGSGCQGLASSSTAASVAGAVETGIMVRFAATPSSDPDGDPLVYHWDFGDGDSDVGKIVTHEYTSTDPVTVTLRVADGTPEDGGAEAMTSRPIPGRLSADIGRTAGTILLSAAPATTLDFRAVPVGGSATQTLDVLNSDPNPVSQVKFTMRIVDDGSAAGAFSLDGCTDAAPCRVDGGAGGQPVRIGFTPQRPGHVDAVIELATNAQNRCSLQLLVHGYGGPGPGVPWGTSATVVGLTNRLFAIRPDDGTTIELGAGTGLCEGGSLAGAPCIGDGDCPGARCGEQSCVGGSNHAQPCASALACPGGTCGQSFDAVDMCTDGAGDVYLFNDDLHDDPDPNCDPCRTGTILRVGVDGTRAIVTQDVTETSPVMGCDRSGAGRVYWADYNLFGPDFDEREQLRSERKSGGSPIIHVQNINRRLGDVDPANYIDPSDGFVFYEPSTSVKVSADGSERYVSNFFGLYRLDPVPLFITPDIEEVFSLARNGLVVAAVGGEISSRLNVYKIDPQIAASGTVRLTDVTPWATAKMPNNGTTCDGQNCSRSIFVTSIVADNAGVVFVNAFTSDRGGAVPRPLRPRGTLRFEPRDGDARGEFTGFVDLATYDRLDL